ncbi:sarcosine oxidase subunit gamma [Rhodobacteraceae bacterium M382]|nr:sarcosine oxidase subunit gamma [Rhodobacteraceae bacterium M382]
MVELSAKTPCDGLVPTTIGAITLSEMQVGVMTSVAPYIGKGQAVSDHLRAAHGVGFPDPGQALFGDGGQVIWFGRNQAVLLGAAPDEKLSTLAALTDQGDAWAVVRLAGVGAEEVLARLAPVDLRPGQFDPGQTLRTELAHMAASITRLSDGAFQIMVLRSMAQTLIHDLKSAMEAVAARG